MIQNTVIVKIVYVCIVILLLYRRLRIVKSNRELKKVEGKVYAEWTHKALFVLYFSLFFAAVFESLFFRKVLNLPLSLTGLAMWFFGFNGRKWAASTLGEYWSKNVELRDKHPIIRKGPYKYIRHPNYLFLTMEFFGFAMFGNACWTMLLILVTYVPVIIARAVIEEKKMTESLGQAYLDYKKEVPAFIPYKWI